MDHPAAAHRLLIGVPATVEHASSAANSDAAGRAKWVAELTQAWITLMVRSSEHDSDWLVPTDWPLCRTRSS